MPAFELHRQALPCKAASAMAANIAVQLDVADTQRQVLPIASSNIEPLGITVATAAAAGQAVAVWDRANVVKVLAAASIGAGANVGVVGATTSLGLIAAGASGAVVWAIGKSMTAAAAGEVFSFYINPRQLSGNAP
jgi:hypothetical protein